MAILLGHLDINPDRIKTMADAERLVGSKPREISFSGDAEHYPEPLLTFLLVQVVRPMIAEGAQFERFMYNPRKPFPLELLESPSKERDEDGGSFPQLVESLSFYGVHAGEEASLVGLPPLPDGKGPALTVSARGTSYLEQPDVVQLRDFCDRWLRAFESWEASKK